MSRDCCSVSEKRFVRISTLRVGDSLKSSWQLQNGSTSPLESHCSRRTHDGRPSRPFRLRRGRPPRRDRRGTSRAALAARRFPRARVTTVRSERIGSMFLRRANDAHRTTPITRTRRRTARLAAPSPRARRTMTRPPPSSAPPSPRSRCSPPRSSPPRTSPRPRRRSRSPRAWRARRLPSSSPRRRPRARSRRRSPRPRSPSRRPSRRRRGRRPRPSRSRGRTRPWISRR